MSKKNPSRRPNILSVGGILISADVVETYFACDLEACHGACCIEGDSGAPIAPEEQKTLEEAFPLIADLLPESNMDYILDSGLMYTDYDGVLVTNIVEGERCVFTCFEKDGSARCAFEKSYTEGLGNDHFYKPLSCHLYPIRAKQLHDGTVALNYDRWYPICEPARAKGEKEGIRLYQFVKYPLIRAYGQAWYDELESVAQEYLHATEEDLGYE